MERYYSLMQVARALEVSDQSVRRWIKAGELPAYKPKKEWRIAESDLREFLAERRAVPLGLAPRLFGDKPDPDRAGLLLDALQAMKESYQPPGEEPRWTVEGLNHVRNLVIMAAVRLGAEEAGAGRLESAAQIVARAHEVAELLRVRQERLEADGQGAIQTTTPADVEAAEIADRLREFAGEAA